MTEDMFNEAINELNEIAKYPDNWDGDDASAPKDSTIKRVRKFIELLKNKNVHLNEIEVNCMSYGSVVVDLYDERGLISVEIATKAYGFFTEFADGKDYALDETKCDFEEIPEELKKILM